MLRSGNCRTPLPGTLKEVPVPIQDEELRAVQQVDDLSYRLRTGLPYPLAYRWRIAKTGPADELAQVKIGGSHTDLEIGPGQAGICGVTSAEEVSEIEDNPFDQGVLLHFLFEQVGFVVFEGGQGLVAIETDNASYTVPASLRDPVGDEDLAMRLGFALRACFLNRFAHHFRRRNPVFKP